MVEEAEAAGSNLSSRLRPSLPSKLCTACDSAAGALLRFSSKAPSSPRGRSTPTRTARGRSITQHDDATTMLAAATASRSSEPLARTRRWNLAHQVAIRTHRRAGKAEQRRPRTCRGWGWLGSALRCRLSAPPWPWLRPTPARWSRNRNDAGEIADGNAHHRNLVKTTRMHDGDPGVSPAC
jgi:hypothetical protein